MCGARTRTPSAIGRSTTVSCSRSPTASGDTRPARSPAPSPSRSWRREIERAPGSWPVAKRLHRAVREANLELYNKAIAVPELQRDGDDHHGDRHRRAARWWRPTLGIADSSSCARASASSSPRTIRGCRHGSRRAASRSSRLACTPNDTDINRCLGRELRDGPSNMLSFDLRHGRRAGADERSRPTRPSPRPSCVELLHAALRLQQRRHLRGRGHLRERRLRAGRRRRYRPRRHLRHERQLLRHRESRSGRRRWRRHRRRLRPESGRSAERRRRGWSARQQRQLPDHLQPGPGEPRRRFAGRSSAIPRRGPSDRHPDRRCAPRAPRSRRTCTATAS